MGASDAARREAGDDLLRAASARLEWTWAPLGGRSSAAASRRRLGPAAAGDTSGPLAGER